MAEGVAIERLNVEWATGSRGSCWTSGAWGA